MVNRLEQAADWPGGRAGDRSHSVRVIGDLFHMNIEEDDPANRCAGRRGSPTCSRRQQPTGARYRAHGLPRVFAALHEIGYDDWLTFECRLRGEPEEALPASTRFLSRVLQG